MIKVIRNVALTCFGLTVLLVVLAYMGAAGKLPFHFQADQEELDALEAMEYYNETDFDDYTLCIKLPDGLKLGDVEVDFNYLLQKLTVVLPGIDEGYFYENHLMGGTNLIKKASYIGNAESAGFVIHYSGVYEFRKEEKDGYLYIYAVDPREVYDYIVVIDAGHGGASAPGTVWDDVTEAELDLAIAAKLEEEVQNSLLKIGVYMTRTTDVDVPLERRVALANLLDADLFLSIHNNTNGLKRTDDTQGTEVLYNELDESGESYTFAKICLEELTSNLGSKNRGVVEGSDQVQILRSSQVPVALVEIGFMSNRDELANLTDGAYQKRVAKALRNAIEEGLTTDLKVKE